MMEVPQRHHWCIKTLYGNNIYEEFGVNFKELRDIIGEFELLLLNDYENPVYYIRVIPGQKVFYVNSQCFRTNLAPPLSVYYKIRAYYVWDLSSGGVGNNIIERYTVGLCNDKHYHVFVLDSNGAKIELG